jgi:hypothetical protein
MIQEKYLNYEICEETRKIRSENISINYKEWERMEKNFDDRVAGQNHGIVVHHLINNREPVYQ